MAQTTEERVEGVDAPTLKELGYEQAGGVWYGYVAPAGTPEEVINILSNAFEEALNDPEVLEQIENLDNVVEFLDATDFEKKLDDDVVFYTEAVKALT